MQKVLAIVGPTASGKTKVSVEIAQLLNAEIISADSRQIYKKIPVATAVPTLQERKNIIHHFLEILDIEENYNAGKYGREARSVIDNVLSNSKNVVIVGGSGLYIKSLIDGFFDEEFDTTRERKSLYEKLKSKGNEFLYNELKEIDKITASKLVPSNIRRIIRALEVYYATGRKLSDIQKQTPEINFRTVQFGMYPERSELYKMINVRTDKMIESGLIDEVRNLYDNGFHYKEFNSLNTVGVKEVMMYFDNEINKTEMIETIKMNTRRFAKRQMTWFRKDKRIIPVHAAPDLNFHRIAKEILKIYEDN